jgi:hypothetical protein
MLSVAHSAFTELPSLVTLQVAVEMIFMAAAQGPQQFTPTVLCITLLLDSAALQKQEPP